MGKGKKIPAVEAPIVEKAEEKKTPAKINVMQMGDMEKLKQSYAKNGGLDPNHRVDVLTGIKTYFKDDPNAAANTGLSQEVVDKINGMAAIGFVAALGDEIMMGNSGWAHKMRMTQIEAINEVNSLTGISIDVKALPAPDKNGEVVVKQENIKISKETQKKLEGEKKLNDESKKKDYLNDHTKIETEDQLKEALGFQLVNTKIANPIDRLITAAQFFRAYREARAEKSNDPQAELAKIHECTLADFIQDISTMVPPTFALEGFSKHMYNLASVSGSIIPTFNIFKKASTNRETGVCKFSDEEIATFIRTILVWNITAKMASTSKDIKLLSKDAEKNSKAITQATEKLEDYKKEYDSMLALVSDPSFDVADSFIAAYKDEENPLHNVAKAAYKSIVDTHYKDVDVPELEFDTLLLNVQQHIGVILNLFTSPIVKRDDYSLENLIDMTSTKEEEKQTEEESKNS